MAITEPVLCTLYISILLIEHACGVEHKFEIAVADHGRCENADIRCSMSSDHGHCSLGHSTESIDTVLQDPRFIAVRKGWNIRIECRYKSALKNSNISWFYRNTNLSVTNSLPDPYMTVQENNLVITKIQRQHSGIYFCKFNTSEGEKTSPCETELMVVDCWNTVTAKSRNTMKDAIIMIQTFLILLFILVPVVMLMEMNKKRSLKIEDHTYEGLEAYQTATYEDIQNVRVLSAKSMEAEHPCVQ
ncbi:B-cell antigen receptor complex-associated protein beta chain [Mixophyes fleayi]|uniref:B-cell antigen receptor complex-associated protein beta chain n=1 Tax=Mixophyes fleayi TaxID=3061075 RepID=UPI003F4DE54B